MNAGVATAVWRCAARVGVFAGTLSFFADFSAALVTQPQSTTQDPAKRKQVSELFEQGKRLEALPLAEELVKANPRDDQMMVILAACLVDHAATLADQDAAGRERLRARDLVAAAWSLGNTSTLSLNLSQLLKQLPDNGAIKFSADPAAEQAMRAGEAAFARRDFDEALRFYSKALESDPRNYAAILFIGSTYERQNNFSGAAEWYERAMHLDPNIETAYRYCADVLAKQGDMAKSRRMLIKAIIAEPYNRIVWRELHIWARLNHTQVNEVYVSIPPQQPASGSANAPLAPYWKAYRVVRADWQNGAFAKHFPQEREYRHTLEEELEALTAAADEAERLTGDSHSPPPATSDASLAVLLKLRRAGFLDSYILFSLGDAGIARDYSAYRVKNRDKLEQYLDQFVVPSVP